MLDEGWSKIAGESLTRRDSDRADAMETVMLCGGVGSEMGLDGEGEVVVWKSEGTETKMKANALRARPRRQPHQTKPNRPI